MYSKFSKDSASSGDSAHESGNVNCDSESPDIDDRHASNDVSQVIHEKALGGSDFSQGPSVLQMAFLRLMTQKVIEATANNSAVLKDLNARIRKDRH